MSAVVRVRFIPTGVGNGAAEWKSSTRKPVHPHRRGERLLVATPSNTVIGSSPQAWGTGFFHSYDWLEFRFIPTGVGNGTCHSRSMGIMTVHPHRRGERPARRRAVAHDRGSSPQAWGTVVEGDALELADRFIPTGVGNGFVAIMTPHSVAVHPHRRGERKLAHLVLIGWLGSSPQAWGTGLHIINCDLLGRFIPTGVGNGVAGRSMMVLSPVHPHRRGER